jgi:uncharacterized membrane protein
MVLPQMDILAISYSFGSINLLLIDMVAIVFFVALWVGYSYYAAAQYHRTPNLMRIMDQMRIRWMRQTLKRESRIVDGTLVGNLLRSISFFANTSIFILFGLLTVIGYRESAVKMLQTVPFAVNTTEFMWEVKVFTLAIIFIHAFFKFTWSLRQYNYCCILVGAAPMPNERPETHDDYATKAGNLIANAGRHFNMGLRAYYFGLAAISWFLHPVLFMALTALVVYVLHRREFRSHAVNNMAGLGDGY